MSSDNSPPPKGYRAAEAYLRPSPIYVNGTLDGHLFDLRNCTFTLTLTAEMATATDSPTEIFVPEFHFPEDKAVITVSGGKWEVDQHDIQGVKLQRLLWWHAEGEQNIKVQGVKRQPGTYADPSEDDVSYFEQCQRGQCIVM